VDRCLAYAIRAIEATSAWSEVRRYAPPQHFCDAEDFIGLAIARDIVEGYGVAPAPAR